ncbi:MAG: IgGFc-binding protein [Nannocystaceae bacterium]
MLSTSEHPVRAGLLVFLGISALSAPGCGDSTVETATDSTTESDTTTNATMSETTAGPTMSTEPSGSDTGSESDTTTIEPTTTEPETTETTETTGTTDPITVTDPTTDSDTGPVCEDGEIDCQGEDAYVCEGGQFGPPTPCADGCEDGVGCLPCEEDAIKCEGDAFKVCQGGEYTELEDCPEACLDGVGCVECVPGEKMCNDDGNSLSCVNGTWELQEVCDEVQGVFCNADVGVCDGPCALDNLQLDYIGCDYYAVVTQHFESAIPITNPFTISLSNTTDQEATVTITGGAINMPAIHQVPAYSVKLVALPWVDELYKGTGPSVLVEGGAYRVRSNQPISVVQYSPIKADDTNDASLLIPVNAWTETALVASFPAWKDVEFPTVQLPGFYAVTAKDPDTKVTLLPSATGGDVQGGDGVGNDGTGEITLQPGDVLQVLTKKNSGDLTGTMVSADKPIQVVAGHTCTEVPQGVNTCDHLEETMPPVEALSKEYVVVPPVQVPNVMMAKAQVVRIVALEADTTLQYTPDQMAATNIADAGDFVELPMNVERFVVSSDKPILVAQYMVSAAAGFGQSDPSMVLAVGTDQWRAETLVHAPTSWQANYADILAPTGTGVSVDGMPVPVNAFTEIQGTMYSVAHVALDNGGDGTHQIVGDEPVGVTVYGVQSFGSYWAVGGLDLKHF